MTGSCCPRVIRSTAPPNGSPGSPGSQASSSGGKRSSAELRRSDICRDSRTCRGPGRGTDTTDGAKGGGVDMPTENPDQRAMHVQSIKARVARADYVVDPAAVAEAMLRRADLARGLLGDRAVRRRAHSRRADGQAPRRRG